MADEPIVNGGGGAAVAETAPAAAPVADEGGAGAVEAPAAPVSDIQPLESESTSQFLLRATKEAAAKAAPAADVPVEDKKEDVPPAVEAEKKEPEAPAVEEKKEPVAEAEEDEPFELDPVGPLPPKDLAAKLKENPVLAAELEKAGLKDSIFAASRLAQRVAGYEAVFPDIEAAQYAAKASQDFGALAETFTNVKDPGTARAFMQALLPFSYVLDEDGNPQVDPNTKLPISDGSVGRFMDNVLGLVLDYQAGLAKEKNDEDFAAAIDLLKARTGRGPASAEQEQMTEAQKQEAQRLQTEREAIAREKQEGAERKYQEFETSVAKEVDSEIDKLVDKVLGKVDAANFNSKRVGDDIREAIYEAVKNRPEFFLQMDNLMRRGMSDKVKKERVALAMRTIKPLFAGIAAEKIKAEGLKLKTQQADKEQKLAVRAEQSKSEQRGAGRPAAPAAPPSDEQLYEQAKQELTAKNGREPAMAQVIALAAQKKAQFAQR